MADANRYITQFDSTSSMLYSLSRLEDTRHGDFLGVDEAKYPMDFGSFIRYHTDFEAKITDRRPIPAALTLDELDQFASETKGRYRVKWIQSSPVLA